MATATSSPSDSSDSPPKYHPDHQIQHNPSHVHHTHHSIDVYGPANNLKTFTYKRPTIQNKYNLHIFIPPFQHQYRENGIFYRENKERKTTFTELFYDLAYVAVIARFAAHFRNDISGEALSYFIMKYCVLFTVWNEFTAYFNRFDAEDAIHRIILLIVMTGLIGMGAGSSDITDKSRVVFSLFASLNFFLIAGLYMYILYFIPQIKLIAYWTFGFNFVSGLLFVFSAFFLPVLAVGFIVSFLSFFRAMFLRVAIGARGAVSIEHLTERLGLLVIIVLGEIVIVSLIGHAPSNSFFTIFGALFILAYGFNIHWLYFISQEKIRGTHAMRRNSRYTGYVWFMLHLPFTLNIVLCGSSAELLIMDVKGGHPLSPDSRELIRLLFYVGNLVVYGSLYLFLYLHEPPQIPERISSHPRFFNLKHLSYSFLLIPIGATILFFIDLSSPIFVILNIVVFSFLNVFYFFHAQLDCDVMCPANADDENTELSSIKQSGSPKESNPVESDNQAQLQPPQHETSLSCEPVIGS